MDERREALIRLLAMSPTRRSALGGMAALALLGSVNASAQEATPASGSELILVQAFTNGTLFPTQGDGPDLPPYTLILWGAADGGFFYIDQASGMAGVVPTDEALVAIAAAPDGAYAALVGRPEQDGATSQDGQNWALTLVSGSPGSDPGAVTYQGDVLDTAPPAGPQDFGAGFLILSGLAGVNTEGPDVVQVSLA